MSASHSYGKYSLFSWTTLLLSLLRRSLYSASKSSLANDHNNSTRATAYLREHVEARYRAWRGRREDTGYEEDESFVEREDNAVTTVVRLYNSLPASLYHIIHVEPLRQKLYLTANIQRICLVLRIGNARTNLFISNSDLFGWKLWVEGGGSSKSKDSNLAVRVNYLYW